MALVKIDFTVEIEGRVIPQYCEYEVDDECWDMCKKHGAAAVFMTSCAQQSLTIRITSFAEQSEDDARRKCVKNSNSRWSYDGTPEGVWKMPGAKTLAGTGNSCVLTSPPAYARWREGVNHPMQRFVADFMCEVVVETW